MSGEVQVGPGSTLNITRHHQAVEDALDAVGRSGIEVLKHLHHHRLGGGRRFRIPS
jgi:hypothetical protein